MDTINKPYKIDSKLINILKCFNNHTKHNNNLHSQYLYIGNNYLCNWNGYKFIYLSNCIEIDQTIKDLKDSQYFTGLKDKLNWWYYSQYQNLFDCIVDSESGFLYIIDPNDADSYVDKCSMDISTPNLDFIINDSGYEINANININYIVKTIKETIAKIRKDNTVAKAKKDKTSIIKIDKYLGYIEVIYENNQMILNLRFRNKDIDEKYKNLLYVTTTNYSGSKKTQTYELLEMVDIFNALNHIPMNDSEIKVSFKNIDRSLIKFSFGVDYNNFIVLASLKID